MKKEVITRNQLRKDVYNAKRVWLNTLLTCFYLFLFFNSYNILIILISAVGSWRAMERINSYTLKSLMIEKGIFFITKEKMNIEEGTIETEKTKKDDSKKYEEYYLVTIDNIPCFAYASTEYEIGDDLKQFFFGRGRRRII